MAQSLQHHLAHSYAHQQPLAATSASTACPSSLSQTQSSFQSTKFERLTGRVAGIHLHPLQAANYLAPDLARFIHVEHYPAEAGFGRETRISLNVASTDVRTAALEREGLYHLGHHFSSAELKHAVEQAYPERFI